LATGLREGGEFAEVNSKAAASDWEARGAQKPLVETSTTRSGSVIASGSPGSWRSGRNSAWVYSIILGLKAQTDSFPAQ
jgi:hypothetical protein